jgi:hypothetical protein
MIRGWAMLALSVMSLFAPNVPIGTAVAMGMAALVGMAAVRLHANGERLVACDDPAGPSAIRMARLCDDGAVALCVLATLYAVSSVW